MLKRFQIINMLSLEFTCSKGFRFEMLFKDLTDRRVIFCRHNDVPYQIRIKYHNRFENMTFDTSEPSWHTDIPRLRKGKVGSQVKESLRKYIKY